MKPYLFLLILSTALVRGEGGTNVNINPTEKRAFPPAVFVNGTGQKWYSASELEQIAKDYAKQNRLQFDFEKAGRSIWVYTGGSNIIARISFASDFGKPMYYADIDRSGKVATNFLGVMHE